MSELAADIIDTFETPGPPDGCFAETVTEIEHYSDRLFRFRMPGRRACGSGLANS